MATADILGVGEWIAPGVHRKTWSVSVSGAQIGSPHVAPNLPDKSVFLFSAATAQTNVQIEGTNMPVPTDGSLSSGPWVILQSVSGAALSNIDVTGGQLFSIQDNALQIRPNFTAVTAIVGGGPEVVIISR